MSQRFKVKLSKKEFDEAVIPTNFVAIELMQVEENKKTKSGILVGFNPDEQWGTMEGSDGDTHPADVAEIVGKVVKLPNKLYFNEDGSGMPWETEMELQIGDMVWFNFLESLNAVELHVEGKVIRIIPYADIYVAKRNHRIETTYYVGEPDINNIIYYYPKMKNSKEEYKIICLNGYCLLELIKYPKLSDLDVISENRYMEDKGIIRYFGKPNKRYTSKEQGDNIELEQGRTAYIKPSYKPFLLERSPNLAVFDNGKLYYCVQRRRMAFVV